MKEKRDYKKDKIEYATIIFFSIGIFFFLYFINAYGLFPYHTDEWQHLSMIRYIATNHKINVNPYFGTSIIDYEVAFHAIGSLIYGILGQFFIRYYRLFSFACLSIILFMICFFFKKNKNLLAGITAAVLISTIKSNVNVLGLDFFVPLSIGLFLLTLEIMLKDIKKRMINSIITLLVYPPIGLLIIIVVIFDSINEVIKGYKKSKGLWKNIKKYYAHYVFFILILFVVATVFSIMGIHTAFSAIFFNRRWVQIIVKYNLILLFGIPNLILAAFAVFMLLLNDKDNSLNTNMKIARIRNKDNWFGLNYPKSNGYILNLIARLVRYAFVLAIILILYYAYNVSIIVPIPRAIYVFYFVALFLSGIGMYYAAFYVYSLIKNIFLRYSTKKTRSFLIVSALASVAVILLFVALSYYNSYSEFNSMEKYNSFEFNSKTYAILADLADFTSQGWNGIVIAPPYYSSAIYPITGLRPMAIVPGQLSGGNVSLWNDFYMGNCNTKLAIIKSINKSVMVVSNSIISCSPLKNIFIKSDGYYDFYFYSYNQSS